MKKSSVWKKAAAFGLMLGIATAVFWPSAGRVPPDESFVVLCADTHVNSDKKCPQQREGLKRTVSDILAMRPRPAHVLFLGDLAFDHGVTNDYRLLKKLVAPLDQAGIRWDACMGNHDRRAAFRSVFPGRGDEPSSVSNLAVSVVQTPRAEFVLLDSCLEGPVHGAIDEAQRVWLKQTLEHVSKPVFVCAHHPIKETGVAELMASNALCKAYLYGHKHEWIPQRQEGVDTLCLPSTGHWGDIGFVELRLGDEAVFTLHQRDFNLPSASSKSGDVRPEWRDRVSKNDGSQWRLPLTNPAP